MSELEKLRKVIEEKKEKREKKEGKKPIFESVDTKQVEEIVQSMKKKYAEEGVKKEQVGGKLGELRRIIAEGKHADVEVQPVESLRDVKNPSVRTLSRVYLSFEGILKPLNNYLSNTKFAKEMDYYLISAYMKYSSKQYIALSLAIGLISCIILGLIAFGVLIALKANTLLVAILPIVIAIVVFLLTIVLSILIPQSRAKSRGEAVSAELPFALRHMAAELKAGIGLYKTLQAIAVADYGALSEEFARTITEIEEGTDTRDALKNFSNRTQSKALKNALNHIIRALKTGGNLSDIMNTIAEDVAFEMNMKLRDFSEKMNLFGVLFIFMGIVLPVFLAIISSIISASPALAIAQIPTIVIYLFYFLFMPVIMGFLMFYIYLTQPKV